MGDGRKGFVSEAPYDVIHVGAYIEEVPDALIEQLKPGGVMFVPSGKPPQVVIVSKDAQGNVTALPRIQVAYVPLTSKEHQLGF